MSDTREIRAKLSTQDRAVAGAFGLVLLGLLGWGLIELNTMGKQVAANTAVLEMMRAGK